MFGNSGFFSLKSEYLTRPIERPLHGGFSSYSGSHPYTHAVRSYPGNPAPVPPKLRVFYLASGAIALRVLARLVSAVGIDLIGCATQPDRPAGRRKGPQPTPVGAWCAENGIPVDKPASANGRDFLAKLHDLCPDLVLVFAYGQLLKQELLGLPRLGCVNVHASLLPLYRGASPINAAILAGDRETGISIMQMERGLDSGPVYTRIPLTIDPRETADHLETRLGDLAADHIEPTLTAIAPGELTAVPQDHSSAIHAPKINKTDGHIDWTVSAIHIERQVRAYQPWPGAWFMLPTRKGPRRMTITDAAIVHEAAPHTPGTVVQADKIRWSIACGDDTLTINKVIPEGKREMPSVDFLRGSPLEPGINIHT